MSTLGQILYIFVTVLMYIMFARAILSWFVRDLSNPVMKFLYEVTEPMVSPIRQLVDKLGFSGGMFDFSFIITWLILIIIRDVVVRLL